MSNTFGTTTGVFQKLVIQDIWSHMVPKWSLWGAKDDPHEPTIEPWRAKRVPQVDKSWAKGEVWNQM